jgi:hypothetical protein
MFKGGFRNRSESKFFHIMGAVLGVASGVYIFNEQLANGTAIAEPTTAASAPTNTAKDGVGVSSK